MTRIIDHTQIAILYETITGQCQKRGSISITGSDTLDLDAYLARHPGLDAVVVSASSHPGADRGESFFRQTIATATGKAVFPFGADRCVQVGPTAITPVISVHYGNVPGLDRAPGSNSLVPHMTAEVGDTYSHAGQNFTRRYAVVNPATGLVDQIANLTVGPSVPLPPIPGDVLIPSLTLQVGNTVSTK